MRNFAYKNENFEKDSYIPELKEGNPCYQASAFDSVLYDESQFAFYRAVGELFVQWHQHHEQSFSCPDPLQFGHVTR